MNLLCDACITCWFTWNTRADEITSARFKALVSAGFVSLSSRMIEWFATWEQVLSLYAR
jgi:hypothetical protein